MKQDAVGNVFRPAMDIVDDAMLDFVSPNDVVLPKKPLLKRVANRFRAKKRPQEPRNFDFEVRLSEYGVFFKLTPKFFFLLWIYFPKISILEV